MNQDWMECLVASPNASLPADPKKPKPATEIEPQTHQPMAFSNLLRRIHS